MNEQTREQPDPSLVLDYIEAFRRSKVMFTAVQLGIFDELDRQPQTADQLARTLDLNPAATRRLLDACVALQLIFREESVYHNAPAASTYLASSSPRSFAGYIRYSDQSLFRLWSPLEDAVREGPPRGEQAFGSKDALFDYYYRDSTATANFVRAMNGFGQLVSPRVVRAFDLSVFEHLADLGGATGHFAIAACQAYPNLRATVLDLSRVAPIAREHIAQSGVADRVTFVTADFFSDPLPPADLYSLGRILHDWDVSKSIALLQKIHAALPSGGGVLIAEALLDDNRQGPVYAFMQDINMLVCTEGHERTGAEYASLLEAVGFTGVRWHRTGSLVDAVLAIKA
jgi:acetylserotonin N-methyltransferase